MEELKESLDQKRRELARQAPVGEKKEVLRRARGTGHRRNGNKRR